MPNGIVQKVEGEYAIVQIKRQDMCGDCHACDTVHQAKECTLKCMNTAKSKVGDRVELLVDQTTFLKATYIIYGLPLIGLLAGVGFGYAAAIGLGLSDGDLLMIFGAIIGLLASYLFIKNRDKKNKYKKMLPQIVTIEEENKTRDER